MLKIGINSNCDCVLSDDFYKCVKELGFIDVMLSFKSGDFESNIKFIRGYGLNIPYVHLDNKFGNDLWVKGKSFDRYIQNVCNQIELCGKMGIDVVIMHPACGNPADIPLKPNSQGILGMHKILDVAKLYNVKVAIENVDYDCFPHFKYLLDNIKDENLGFCYDSGHHNLYYSDEDILKSYGHRLIAVHLHDNLMDWEYGYDYSRDLHRLPFDGKINYDDVCEKLAKTNLKIIMLEVRKRLWEETNDLYKKMSDKEFLTLARDRAIKLVQLIQKYKK